jgi:hypothetical protein
VLLCTICFDAVVTGGEERSTTTLQCGHTTSVSSFSALTCYVRSCVYLEFCVEAI